MIAQLFGLALAPLYAAIAQVESDRGATSANVYQLRNIYIDDVNRICSREFLYEDRYNKAHSEDMMAVYWKYYGRRYQEITGKVPTYEVLARIHNGGPDGWRKDCTLGYWARVKRVLEGGAK